MKYWLNKKLLFLSLDVKAWVVIFLVLVLSSISVYSLKSLKFDYNIENFFSEGDEEVEFYSNHKKLFENENDYLFIGISNSNEVFDQQFLQKIDTLTSQLEQTENIVKVLSPTRMSTYLKMYGVGYVKSKVLHLDLPAQLKSDKQRLEQSESYERGFFSHDFNSLNIVVGIKESISKKETKILFDQIKKEVKAYHFDDVNYAGRIRTQEFYLSQMRSEMGTFSLLTIGLVILLLVAVLRNGIDALMILIVLFISILMTFGIIAGLGYSIDLMMILLPTIILITGTSAGIHLLSRYRKDKGKSIYFRLSETIKTVGMPLLFNALTTAAGFLSLLFIPVDPIGKFGLFAAISIVITFVLIVVFIPALIRLFRLDKTRSHNRNSVLKQLTWSLRISNRFAMAGAVLVIVLIYATANLKINNYFLDDLDDQSELKKELMFFENNFSGIRPFEISMKPKSKELNLKNLAELEELSVYLSVEMGVGLITGPHQIFKAINKSNHHGSNDSFKLPESDRDFNKIAQRIESMQLWNKFTQTYNQEANVIRLAGRTNDVGSVVNIENTKKLNKFIDDNITEWDVHVTGAAFLMDKANHEVSYNILIGILLAILVSTLCIWWLTSSLKLAFISILPNVLPMLFAGGLMWAFDVPLKIGTAVVFTIIYGLAVDDTLHFVHRFNSNRREGQTTINAIQESFDHLKGPMSNTTIVLSIGFLIFGMSHFQSISMMGILIGVSLVVALIVDLYLLPYFLYKTKV